MGGAIKVATIAMGAQVLAECSNSSATWPLVKFEEPLES